MKSAHEQALEAAEALPTSATRREIIDAYLRKLSELGYNSAPVGRPRG